MQGQDLELRPSRRQVLGWGAAGVLGATLAVPGESRAQGLRSIKLLHAANVVIPLWSITYLAEDMGYYKEEGLAVERVGLNNGPSSMAALLSGAGQSNFSTPGELLATVQKGQGVTTLMSHQNFTPYVLISSKQFADKHKLVAGSSLSDREAALRTAKGARLGITTPGSLTDILTRLAVKQVGLDPAKDLQIVPMQSIANITAAIANNAIDAFMSPSPTIQQAIAELGAYSLLSIGAGDLKAGMRLQGQVLEARTEDIKANPDLYAAIVRADLRAMRMIVERPDEARNVLRKTRFSAIKEDIWPAVWANELPTFQSPYVTKDSLMAWIETGLIEGAEPTKFPYDKAIDMQFVDAGLKKIGWSAPART